MKFGFADEIPVDEADSIPAEFRPLYNEDGENLILDTEKFGGIRSAVQGLNKALSASRNEAKTYRSKAEKADLGVLSEFGETPDGIRETFQERLASAAKKAVAMGDEDSQRRIEKARLELVAQNEKTLGEKDGLIEKRTNQLKKTLGKSAALNALSEKGGSKLLLPHVLEQTSMVENDDGELILVVVDSDGDPRVNPVTQLPFTLGDLVDLMKDDDEYGKLFQSEAPSGGDARPSPRPSAAKSVSQQRLADMKPVDKIALGLRKGQARNGTGQGRMG